jgi:cell division septation protein DedD
MPSIATLRILRVGAASLGSLMLGSFLAAAQNPSLADVARKEEERRKALPPPAKVLTNKDLPKVTSSSPAPAPGAEATDAGTAAPDAPQIQPGTAAQEPHDEEWWRTRMAEAREELRRDEVLVDALQSRVNGLTSEFVARDDPYQRTRIGTDRQKALAEMERLRTEITGLKKKIADIEEEARKASVPPGWLR